MGSFALYPALAQMTDNDLCLVIGSGNGSVPKLLKQAQRDLHPSGRTVIVDAGQEAFYLNGCADYIQNGIPGFPDIEIRHDFSSNAVAGFADDSIDYLHIDGDHRYEGVSADFFNYWPKVKIHGIITLHDSAAGIHPDCQVSRLIEELRSHASPSFDLFDITWVGTGIAGVIKKDSILW